MDNKDIEKIKTIMEELDSLKVKGIFYYDVGILNIYNCNSYRYELVLASEHATTNYQTINYWYQFNAHYCLLSSDITISEVFDIKKNTTAKLILPIFGYQPMFNSKRHIVKNYLEYFNIDDNSKINYMEKEGKKYPIIDNEEGTCVYTDYVLNGIQEYCNLSRNNIDYVLLNSFNLDSEKFINVLKILNEINNDNIDQKLQYINSLFDNCNSGFMYKNTISKVKKSEK